MKNAPLTQGTEDGVTWATAAGPAGWCINGYVKLPADLVLDAEVEVHGGLTFEAQGWIGFDTAHAADFWSDDELLRHGITPDPHRLVLRDWADRWWTLEQLEDETRNLARQVAAMREVNDRFHDRLGAALTRIFGDE